MGQRRRALSRAALVLFAAALIASAVIDAPQALAQSSYKRVPGTPTAVVPGYNVEIGVWAYDTGLIGSAVGLFELRADGDWYNIGGAMPVQNLGQVVLKAGGAHAYLLSIMPQLQAALDAKFPPLKRGDVDPPGGPTITGDPNIDAINTELYSGFTFKTRSNGTVSLAPK